MNGEVKSGWRDKFRGVLEEIRSEPAYEREYRDAILKISDLCDYEERKVHESLERNKLWFLLLREDVRLTKKQVRYFKNLLEKNPLFREKMGEFKSAFETEIGSLPSQVADLFQPREGYKICENLRRFAQKARNRLASKSWL